MLATAKHLGYSLDDYLEPEHPIQQSIIRALCEVADVTEDLVGVATDGCSAPNFSIPLKSTALAYARLADPSGQAASRRQSLERVFGAMAQNPELISGPRKLDALLMQIGSGNLVAKEGAEGVLGIALRNYQGTALGIGIKVWDGDKSGRALAASALAVLSQLGWMGQDQRDILANKLSLAIETRRGKRVGEVRPSFQLERANG
jgi:L-asparaginase II